MPHDPPHDHVQSSVTPESEPPAGDTHWLMVTEILDGKLGCEEIENLKQVLRLIERCECLGKGALRVSERASSLYEQQITILQSQLRETERISSLREQQIEALASQLRETWQMLIRVGGIRDEVSFRAAQPHLADLGKFLTRTLNSSSFILATRSAA